MGRPRQPTALKSVKGERKDRVNDDEPVPSTGEVVCPSSLSNGARDIWNRLAPDMISKGTLTPWDVDEFAALCDALERLDRSSQHLDAEGEVIEAAVFDRNGQPTGARMVQNPWWQIYKGANELVLRYGARFGLNLREAGRALLRASSRPGGRGSSPSCWSTPRAGGPAGRSCSRTGRSTTSSARCSARWSGRPEWRCYVRRYRIAYIVLGPQERQVRARRRHRAVPAGRRRRGSGRGLRRGEGHEAGGQGRGGRRADAELSPLLNGDRQGGRLNNKNSADLRRARPPRYYEVITADALGELGHNPHGFVPRRGAVPGRRSLFNAMRTAMGTRTQPLM
jgi:phage terminase small subunit